MRGVTQKISAAYEVAAELCLLFQVIIYKPVFVDIASTLEVNHVKSMCCATIHVIVFYLFVIGYSLHELYYQLLSECMLSLVYSSMED